jgi:hypothetical protein
MVDTYIGIDPGVMGGIAILDAFAGGLTVYKMPSSTEEILTLLHQLTQGKKYCHVILEQVHASPQMGVSSAFTFGRMFGQLEAFVHSLPEGKTFELVTPQKWQATLDCRTGGDKHVSLQKAETLFPGTKGINLKTADAALLAYFGYWKHGR